MRRASVMEKAFRSDYHRLFVETVKNGLTRHLENQQIADLLGVSQSYISRMLGGKAMIRLVQLRRFLIATTRMKIIKEEAQEKLADALGISLSDLENPDVLAEISRDDSGFELDSFKIAAKSFLVMTAQRFGDLVVELSEDDAVDLMRVYKRGIDAVKEMVEVFDGMTERTKLSTTNS